MSDTQPSAESINAVLELQEAVKGYKVHGHGYFVWKAFLAMRNADRIGHLSGDVDIHRETVFAGIEEIARGILDLGEVTSDGGRKQLLNALKWADKGGASSAARMKESAVVDRLRIVFSMLLNYSDAKLGAMGNPAWKDLKSFDGAFQMVAEETGESKSNVRKIWESATSSGIGMLYANDAAAAIDKRKAEIMGRSRKPRARASSHKPVKPMHWRNKN